MYDPLNNEHVVDDVEIYKYHPLDKEHVVYDVEIHT